VGHASGLPGIDGRPEAYPTARFINSLENTMHRYLRSLLFAVASLLTTGRLSPAAEHTTDPPATVLKKVTEKQAILIDVREPSEWDEGHLQDAILVPLGDLRVAAKKDPALLKKLTQNLPKDKPIYAHCRSGGRCLVAADILAELGYEVRALKPGYEDLLQAGFKKAESKK
jgi:rhodanese-related sulfurtransferase